MNKPTLLLLAALCGPALAQAPNPSQSAASSPAAHASMLPPTGYWRVVDDDTVIEFVPCANDASSRCAQVRGWPSKQEPGDDPPPACGETVAFGFKPDAGGQRWTGRLYDPVEKKSLRAQLQTGKAGGLELKVFAFGGLYSETMALVPAGNFTPCSGKKP